MSTVSPRPAQPDLRDALLETAVAILAKDGPGGLSTRRLARELSVSTMAVYTYFGGMDDLVRALVHEGFARLNDRMSRVAQSNDPVADVAALGRVYRANAASHPYLYSVMFGGSKLAGFSLTDDDRRHGLYTLEILVGAVRRCMDEGRFQEADAQLVAHQFWTALHGLVTLELGGYLFDPYNADICFDAQVGALIVGSGDSLEAAARSLRHSVKAADVAAAAAASESVTDSGPADPVQN
jgi:AcrR family transcriptional regulator